MKKLLLFSLLVTLFWPDMTQAQSLTYGYAFDISNGGIPKTPFNVGDQESMPGGIAFSNDGTKMFVVGFISDAVQQYQLTNPFDVTAGVSFEGSFDISGQEMAPTDITFNDDGTKMYVTGNFSDGVNQYILNTPFDITDINQVTFDDIFEFPGNASLASISFNTNGTKMFLVNAFDDIDQYTLTTPFDVTGTVTDDMISFDTNPHGTTVRGFEFSPNGFKLFITFDDGGTNGTDVNQFSLTNPFDISTGVSFESVFDIINEEPSPMDLTFSADGTKLFVIGNHGNSTFPDDVQQYDLNIGGFSETAANDGTVEGSLKINLFQETFNNAGGTLALTTDYSVTGIPVGLNPVMSVDASGSFATLTLSGTATDHQDINDVAEINITFQNSAFSGGDATIFDNVTNASTSVGINFFENVQSINYGSAFDFSGGVTFSGQSDVIVPGIQKPFGMVFSNDGMTLLAMGGGSTTSLRDIVQYSLNNPFDVTAGLTQEGSPINLESEISDFGTGLAFSSDGMKLFILANQNVYQYSLATPFSITGGMTLQDEPFNVSSQETSPEDIAFSTDGSRMFILGSRPVSSVGDEVNAYDLTVPFDITSGVSFDNQPFSLTADEEDPTGFSFSADGTRMFVVGDSGDDVTQYNLAIPFDLTTQVTIQVMPFDYTNEFTAQTQTEDVTFSATGDKMFILTLDEEVFQYDLAIGGFTESVNNDGSVQGSVIINILGDKFNNGGSVLTPVTDYAINNLPAGLTPTLSVAADGFSATLTLTGNATNNQEVDDISSLEFSFENIAFEGNDASEVTNATDANSNFSVDFRDNNPRINYGLSFDLTNALADGSPFSLTGQVANPTGMAFSDNGTKMLILDAATSEVKQFSLTNPFDITSGVVIEGTPLNVVGQGGGITGLTFNADGTRIYVVGVALDRVSQYSLTIPYQITSGVSFEGSTNSLQGEDESPQSVVFSSDGMKMFIAGAENGVINQYSLTTAFDITAGVSFDNVAFSIANEESFPTGAVFSTDGLRMFVVGTSNANVSQYLLTNAFDLTSGVLHLGDFNIGGEEAIPRDITFSANGSSFFIVGTGSFAANQYRLTGSLTEAAANDGTIEGSTTIGIIDDAFTSAGGTLDFGVDYTINNLPSGLTPSLSIAADGYYATLTLGGMADSHPNANDVSSLEFTFENSAFSNSDAVDVANAVDAESNIGIDFIASEETDIVSFVFAEQSQVAVINTTTHTVEIEVLSGTDQSSLTPTITISDGATITANSGVERDFNDDVTYTVTSESGADQVWTISVTQLGLSGTYTVGNGGDFETLAQFISTVDIAGMDDRITLRILDNHTETGDFVFDNLEETLFIRPETSVSTATFNGSFLFDNTRIRFLSESTVNSQQITINGTDVNAPAINLTGTKDGSTFSHLKVNYVGQRGINLNGDGISVDVYYCEFNHTSPSLINVAVGVSGTPSMGDILISNNKFLNFNGGSSRAIRVYNAAYIYNNVIFIDTPGSTSPIGIRVVDGAGEVVIDQNTIHITGGASDQISGSVGIFAKSTASGRFEIVNNIISIDRLTNAIGSTVGVEYQTGSSAALVDHNHIDDYSSLVDNWLFGLGNSIEMDISDFSNSTSSITEFTDADNGDLTLAGTSLTNDDLRSTFIPARPNFAEGGTDIREDHNVVTRNTLFPSKGAFEYDNELANLLSFSVPDQTEAPTIDATNRTVDLTITSGANISQTPTIEVSNGATISPLSGAIQNFATHVTYTVTSEVNAIAQNWTVTIKASPISVDLDENEHDELLAANTSFTTFFVNDPNTNDNHTVELVSGAGDTDNAFFAVDGTNLINLEAFDFETREEYSIRLRATDPDGLFVESAVMVFVNDINESPTIADQSFQVAESEGSGFVIGTIAATDPENDNLSFSALTGEISSVFNVSNSGVLTLSRAVNFEEEGPYSFDVTVTDDETPGLSATATITVNVTNVNEVATNISLANLTVDESNPIGTVVGALTSTDQDANDTHTYTLVPGSGDTGNSAFSISGSNLLSAEVLDFETQNSYSIRVQTTDAGGLTFEQSFSIGVNDLPASITSLQLSNNSIDENQAIGTEIGMFNSSGEDLSGSFIYTLVVGDGDADNGSFSISENQLLAANSFNFEQDDNFSIRVKTDDGEGNVLEQSFTISVLDVFESTDANISAFSFEEQTEDATISTPNKTVAIEVERGSDLTNLTPTMTISANANIAPDLGTPQDFTDPVTYVVTAEDGTTTANWIVTVTAVKLTDTDILGFVLNEQTKDPTIDDTNHTVSVEVIRGTDVATLSPTITLSEGATISPEGGIAQDFTSTVSYTVTAEDGTTTQDWTITISEAPNTETDILTFAMAEQTGTASIDATDHTVSVEVMRGTDITSLSPSITLSDGATISPAGGTAQDFTSAVTYTVTSEDGTITQDWVVEVKEAPNTGTDIQTFVLSEQTGTASIDATNHTVSVEVMRGTDLTLLSPTITLSEGAASDPASGVTQDFTSAVTYVVTAEDGTTTQSWIVTVTEAPNNETDILTFELSEQTSAASIDATNHMISIEVERSTELSSLSPTITLSEGATAEPTNGNAQDFTSSVTYTVTAEDGTTTQDWIVSVTQAPNTATDIETFTLPEETGAAIVNTTDHTVSIEVSRDTDLSTLSPTIIVSSGATITPGSGTMQDFSSTVTYTVTAEDASTTQIWTISVSNAPNRAPVVRAPLSDQNQVPQGFSAAQFNYAEVFEDADDDALTISVTSSDEQVATAQVVSNNQIQVDEVGVGTTMITLIANDGRGGTVSDTFVFTVLATLNIETDILTFELIEQTADAMINSTDHTIFIEVTNGTGLTDLIPEITLSEGAIIDPESGTPVDFTNTVVYRVTAEDGTTTQDWEVTVNEQTVLGVIEGSEVQVYPNPVVDQLVIQTNKGDRLLISDQQGRRVLNEFVGIETILDVKAWAPGVYFIKITNPQSGYIYNNKIIKY